MDRTKLRYSVFQFDNMGNITRLQRHTLGNRLIDDLQFTYSGNQVTAITDYAGSLDRYDTKEYTDRSTSAGTVEQRYDANGNLTTDLDRGIQRIRYNILNLPDTVFFTNGNRLVNSYDATGRKWQSQTVTLRESEVMPTDDGTVFDAAISSISLTQYDGTMEYRYTTSRNTPNNDFALVSRIVHNAEGYVQYAYHRSSVIPKQQMPPLVSIVVQTQCYYHRDHLGNNCAVWDATNDSIAQRTWYYASGTPMSISTMQGLQPYKYNGKEYVEAHGYDTYDYGFRGYYATIGRFTSIDPLTERTPWQGPYTYANNNWVNLIDYAGLFGTSFSQGSCNWVAVDNFGKVLGSDMKSSDRGVYLVDNDDWDGTYGGLLDYPLVGWQIEGINYVINGYYDFYSADLGGVFIAAIGSFMAIPQASTISSSSSNTTSFVDGAGELTSIMDIANTINGNIRCNEFFWIGANGKLYFDYQIGNNYCYARSQRLATMRNLPRKNASSIIGKDISILGIMFEAADVYDSRTINPSNVFNTSIMGLSLVGTTLAASPAGAVFVTAVVVYTATDIIVGLSTGQSLSDRMNTYWGPLYQW